MKLLCSQVVKDLLGEKIDVSCLCGCVERREDPVSVGCRDSGSGCCEWFNDRLHGHAIWLSRVGCARHTMRISPRF